MPSNDTARRSLAGLVSQRKWALLLLGLVVGAFLVMGTLHGLRDKTAFHNAGTADGKYYEIMVKQWLTKGVYGYKSEKPNSVVTPGYPVVLAGVYAVTGYANAPGGPYRLVFAINMLFAAGSIVLTYLIGSELLGRGPGLIAAALMAAFPPMASSAEKILTEPLAMVLFLGYLYAQLVAMRRDKAWMYAVAGGLFAWLVMVRPSFMPLAVLPFAYALFRSVRDWRRLLVPVGMFAAAFALVVSPWVAWNAVTFHVPRLMPNGRGDPVLAGVDPYYWEMGPQYRYSGPSYMAYLQAHKPGQPVPPQFDMLKEQYAYRVMGSMLRHQPVRFLGWMTIGKFRAMYGRTWEAGSTTSLTVTWIVQSILVAFGFAGMLLAWRDDRLRIPALLVLFGTLSLLPFVPEPRFVFGLLPLLAVLAAGTLQRAWIGAGGPARAL